MQEVYRHFEAFQTLYIHTCFGESKHASSTVPFALSPCFMYIYASTYSVIPRRSHLFQPPKPYRLPDISSINHIGRFSPQSHIGGWRKKKHPDLIYSRLDYIAFSLGSPGDFWRASFMCASWPICAVPWYYYTWSVWLDFLTFSNINCLGGAGGSEGGDAGGFKIYIHIHTYKYLHNLVFLTSH